MDNWTPSHINFYAISLLFVVPYLFLFRKSVFPTTPKLPQPSTILRPLLTILVVLHTLHSLRLLLSPPVNLFKQLNLPLTAPVSAIRVALLEHQRDQFPVGFLNKISPDVEVLLTRLASFEARVIYVRYGPYPLSHCGPCVHLSDFALFALAPSVLPYLYAVILVSLLTSRVASRQAWRTPCLVVLTAALLTEAWWTIDGDVHFQDGKLDGWTHTHTYIARHTLLLILPLLIHHIPEYSSPSAIPPFFTRELPLPTFPHQSADFRPVAQTPQAQRGNPPLARSFSTPTFAHAGPSGFATQNPARPNTPVSALTGTLSSLSTAVSTLRVLEWARIAGLRRDGLREKMSSYYAAQEGDAEYARSDDRLQHEAERLGMGYWKKSDTRPRFGGNSSTWRGNGDPRGLDKDSAMQDDEEEGDHDFERAQRQKQKQTEMEQSPLRAKARQAAQELAQNFFRKGRPRSQE